MGQLFVIGLRSLLQHRRRNGLLFAAIALVTALLVILVGLSRGMTDTMLTAATTLSTGHVNVAGFYKVTSGSAAPLLADPAPVVELVRKYAGEIDYLALRSRGFGRFISDTASLQSGVFGVDVASEKGLRTVLQPAPTRLYWEQGGSDEPEGALADLAQPNSLLLFASQAKRLGVRVGDSVTISTPTWRGVNNSMDLRVVAVAKDVGFMSSFNTFIPTETLHRIYQMAPQATGAIQIYLSDSTRSSEVSGILRGELAKAGYQLMEPQSDPFWVKLPQVQGEDWTGQKLDVTTWEDEISFLMWTLDTFDMLTVVLVAVLLVLIVIGILNTLWIAVRERTGEIGTMRAIGMSQPKVAGMFFVEAGILGVAATVTGALLAAGLAAWVNAAGVVVENEGFRLFIMSDTLVIAVRAQSAASSAAIIAFVTVAASVAPAVRAARLRPITAMRHVG